ncbi:MAG: glyoxylate/hydroxypyruvate reductase A [Rhodospirillales bacterium]|nr:glyoxylate/hydroxypyruvate reductase A [Rhodospirillales bacterium]
MNLMFISNEDRADQWRDNLTALLPDLNFYVWPDDQAVDPATIDYVLAWKPAPGIIKRFPNLKAILSLGAGIDGITCDPELPIDKPLVHLVDRSLTQGMVQFALYWVLHFHRQMGTYQKFAEARTWRQLPQAEVDACRVGILGFGELGQAVGSALAAQHFDVAGWSRSPKQIAGITSYAGAEALPGFLGRSDMLICLLPLTPETEGIIDAALLAALPRGAIVINLARGRHLVDADLLAALDSGHLSAAVLDVFYNEPLAAEHPFWAHEKVTVTPHIAALTSPRSGADSVAANIERIERGETPLNLIDLARGY